MNAVFLTIMSLAAFIAAYTFYSPAGYFPTQLLGKHKGRPYGWFDSSLGENI